MCMTEISTTMEIPTHKKSSESESLATSQLIQEEIETAIIRGEFSPGEHLDESRLARRYGVSRTPIREAFEGLSAARLVVKRRNAGVFVVKPSLDEIMEMFELVATLESFAAKKAAIRATVEDLTLIRQAHEKCIEAAKTLDPLNYYTANQVFHERIFIAAKNSALTEQIASLDKRLSPYRRLVTFRPHRIEESNAEHQAILEAIENRTPEIAELSMEKHLDLLAEDALTLAKSAKVLES